MLLSSFIQINDQFIGIGKFWVSMEKIQGFFFKILNIIFIVAIMFVMVKLGTKFIDKFIKKQSKMKVSLDVKKASTLGTLLKSILRYTVYFFGMASILTQIVGPISLTFAGMGGVAIGFAAQNFVKDIINGFFILFEDQFTVDDYIDIEQKSGIVEGIGLRLTKIRDFNGDLHLIPNGNINTVTNHSRGSMRVLIDVDIAREEDIDNVVDILNSICENFKNNENIVDGPKVIGVTAIKEFGFTVRVVGRAKPMTQWECENALRKEIKNTLDLHKVKVPYPKRVVIKGDSLNNV
ncbi:mechanosensitive ion channel family protein [Clostridium putrefaciens]|uniref:Mechanosensitive ion channel family protein n=1 Tax=Clostridium putrefaciens TaxID=99675 RepID=A0A381JDP0_9CLOT|nr:mechanosensitive ion channel family protein [Clostridium putrefaciens]SUY48536.1 mechanosensitive ion channel family protein [Clostridium putrefaciens]